MAAITVAWRSQQWNPGQAHVMNKQNLDTLNLWLESAAGADATIV